MAVYRCAACGSPNVVTDTQKEGYDYVKGAIGTAILGTGGAVAGINGKTKQVYKCPDCGLTMNTPMPNEVKTLIDIGVMDVDARKRLKLRGVPIEWDFLLTKYRNIEHGVAEQIAASREAHREEMRNIKDSLEWQLAFDYTSDEGKALLDSLKAKMEAEIAVAMEAEEAEKAKKAHELQMQQAELQKQKSELEAERKQITQTIADLGFFNFAKKKRATADLDTVNEKIEKLDEDISALWEASNDSTQERFADTTIQIVILMKNLGFAMTKKQIDDALKYLGYLEANPFFPSHVTPRLYAILNKDIFKKEFYSEGEPYHTLAE